jgi:hypothetical protein
VSKYSGLSTISVPLGSICGENRIVEKHGVIKKVGKIVPEGVSFRHEMAEYNPQF